MTLDRTKPPPGFESCDSWWPHPGMCKHAELKETFGGEILTLEEAWTAYDSFTLPARVALLRELAAEFDRPDPVRPPPYDDTLDRTLAEAVSSNNEPHGAIAIELLRRADALEAGK